MKKDLFALLYKSFETDMTPDEQETMDRELHRDPELKRIREEISGLRQQLQSFGRENFPSTFEEELSRKANPIFRMKELQGALPDVLTAAFRKVSISGVVVFLFLLLYNLSAGNDNIIKNFLGNSAAAMKHAYDPSAHLMWTDSK